VDASALGAAAVIVVFGLLITSEQVLRWLILCTGAYARWHSLSASPAPLLQQLLKRCMHGCKDDCMSIGGKTWRESAQDCEFLALGPNTFPMNN